MDVDEVGRAEVAIGVVMVNYWKDGADTLDALESLRVASPRPAHVVVVDNGSADRSIELLDAWIVSTHNSRWVTLLQLGYNSGFSAGNNAGVALLAERADVDAFLLLNNDTTVAPDFFARLAEGVSSRPDAALYGATIYESDASTVWYAGGTEHPNRVLFLHEFAVPDDGVPRETEFVTGCAMLVPRRTLERLGGLPELYFPGYWEDAEYSYRARTLGPLIYVPRAVVYHKVGASMGAASVSPRIAYVENRHRALFARRNYTGFQRLVSLGYLAVTKPARMLKEVARGNSHVGIAILRGTLAGAVRGESGPPPRPYDSFR